MELFSVLRFFIRLSLSFKNWSTNLEFARKLPKTVPTDIAFLIGMRFVPVFQLAYSVPSKSEPSKHFLRLAPRKITASTTDISLVPKMHN